MKLILYVKNIPGFSLMFKFFRLLFTLYKNNSFHFLTFAGPGHFYSPIPSNFDILPNFQDFDKIRERTNDIAGVKLNSTKQLSLLAEFAEYMEDIPFPKSPNEHHRYYFDNSYFSYGDAIVTYCFLRHYNPRIVIEIGSGFSSALMLDTRKYFKSLNFDLHFIEPFPDRLLSLIHTEDQTTFKLYRKKVQEMPTDIFKSLQKNDILFIDSSHVGKVGSDLLDILFRILPLLAAGVIIHFHDIPWPFEYPASWYKEGRAWNEVYYLRALLQGSNSFEILFFNDYLKSRHMNEVSKFLPLMLEDSNYDFNLSCSSIWLLKN